MKRLLLLTTLTTAFATLGTSGFAQTGDAAPLDAAQLLQALRQFRDQNEAGMKTRRLNAYQTVAAAATSPERAAAYWKDAVKAVQFEGAEKEGAQIRDWRDGEGEALNDRLCAGAARLHLQWLALSLQYSAGAEMKTLLPKVLEHIAAVHADELAAEHLQDQLDKAKDRNPASPGARKTLREDSVVRKVHDQIMRTPVSGSPVAKWMRIGELLEGTTGKAKAKDAPAGWEYNPANTDGMYSQIVLPEYRATKDPRLLDYWDMVLKREADRVADKKLDVEQRDWNQVKKPRLQWSRSQDVVLLGNKNRGILEMFTLVKAFPNHPDAPNWISQLEVLLSPPPSGLPPEPSASAPALIPGVPLVPAPATVPPATVPGAAPIRPAATPAAPPVRPGTTVPPTATRPVTPTANAPRPSTP